MLLMVKARMSTTTIQQWRRNLVVITYEGYDAQVNIREN